MHEHGPEMSEYFFPLVRDFVLAKPGQQPRAFVFDFFHDSGAVRILQEYHFRFSIHCGKKNTKFLTNERYINRYDIKTCNIVFYLNNSHTLIIYAR